MELVHGVIGAGKALLGIDRAPDAFVRERIQRCAGGGGVAACNKLRGLFCEECGCIVSLKVRVGSESCPIGRWSAVNGDN